MKTRELIAQLNECDPTGELEVCIGNVDIHFVGKEPAYYDGCLQVLKRDEACEYYNIIGAEFRSGGFKIVINELNIADALLNNPEMPVTFDSEYSKRHKAKWVEDKRAEMRAIKARVERR